MIEDFSVSGWWPSPSLRPQPKPKPLPARRRQRTPSILHRSKR